MLQAHVEGLSSRQQLHYASGRYALLLIFQGMDSAGKDGAIRHVMSGVNPEGCEVYSFKQPSAEELKHDFLWRTTCRLPERGRIGIFNRSYYEEVLDYACSPRDPGHSESSQATRVDAKHFWRDRYRSIVDSGGAFASKRHPDRQILPSPIEEGAGKTLPRAHRRTPKKLEIQCVGHSRKKILEALHACIWRLPGRNQHAPRTLVLGSRR